MELSELIYEGSTIKVHYSTSYAYKNGDQEDRSYTYVDIDRIEDEQGNDMYFTEPKLDYELMEQWCIEQIQNNIN